MLRRLTVPKDLTTQEARQITRPALLAILVLCCILILYAVTSISAKPLQTQAVFIGIFGVFYASSALIWQAKWPQKNQPWKWPLLLFNSAISIATLVILPEDIIVIPYAILMLAVAIQSIIWDRISAYAYMSLNLIGYSLFAIGKNNTPVYIYAEIFAIALLTVVVVELNQSMTDVNMNRIQRLQTINEFIRQISFSLERNQVLSIVGAAIQKAIEADTYFLGLATNENHIFFHLLYDDGQFFPPTEVPLDGTLSGWVLRNQRSLFIPDMREDVNLEGVRVILTGNNRNNACWMGVPLRAGGINGVIAVASYRVNAFDRTALELLENLAQHAALALDNANHLAEVEAKSRLDSLTEIYNHGHIVDILRKELEKAQLNGTPLSLVMLDIDYFKQYNDNYGHQLGDEVLVRLTKTIQQHIKSTDAVGRWGGEEFTIVLPGANGMQAMQIAQRVRETVNHLYIPTHSQKTIPFPTVSLGIAVFPAEATEADKLIHLADQRLYIAKERGRNQIEPNEAHWQKIVN